MTSSGEKRKTPRRRKNSPSSEEGSCDENSLRGSHLKKGPWTPAEDAILMEYVMKHGEGNWNLVQKHSGLSRCGKSCRLRWANHLRPDLKKGSFTPDEEARIIELHTQMGNKWARMAAELPGRTDNEIKNFWNTRIKRLQRAGLPIYPPNVHIPTKNMIHQSDNSRSCRNGDEHHSETSQSNPFEIPDVEFKNLGLSQEYINCSPSLPDISPTNVFMFPSFNPHKRPREVETPFPGPVLENGYPTFDHHDNGRAPSQPPWSPPTYDNDLDINQYDGLGSPAPINDNSSSSEPIPEAMKMELPSLQFSASQVGSWAPPPSPLPSLESVDTLIQSPVSVHTQSNCPSPHNNGLLEAIVHESESFKTMNYDSNNQISAASIVVNDGVESLSQNVGEMKWDSCCDPVSPVSQSGGPVYLEFTPGSGGSSSDEPQSAVTISGKFNPEALEWALSESDVHKDISCPFEDCRPDVMLDSSFWFNSCIGRSEDQSIITGDVGAILDDDLICEYKQEGSFPCDESNMSFGLGDSTWDNI